MRVLLADDHRLIIEGVSNMLALDGIEVVGIANDGLEAVQMAGHLRPDLILMDIRMPRCDGLAATRLIKAAQPEIKIVMLTTSTEDQDLFEAIKSGACGYLIKTMRVEAFLETLRGVEEGVPPFSPGLAARLLDEFARLSRGERSTDHPNPAVPAPTEPEDEAALQQLEADGLTERQAEVLKLVAGGLTYKEVGERMSLSEHTVRFHMTKIMNNLHLYNRAEVLEYARRMGLKKD
jgi:DNA-binding NarL/FixJ family response regulator